MLKAICIVFTVGLFSTGLLCGCEHKDNAAVEKNAAQELKPAPTPVPEVAQPIDPAAVPPESIPTAIEDAPSGSAQELTPEEVQDAATDAQEENTQGHE